MAEMNELLAQAAAAAEALAAETARARDTLADLARGAVALAGAVDEGTREAEDRLEQTSARLADAEQELSRDAAATIVQVQALAASARRVQGGAASLLARVGEDLRGLRAEKERALSALETDADGARAALVRYAEAMRALEGEATLHGERQRALLDAVRAEALALRQQAGARVESLADELRSAEETCRAELAGVAESYAALGAALLARSEGAQQAVQAFTEDAAAGLEQRLGRDAVEAAQAAAETLGEALAAVERGAAGSTTRQGRGFEEVGRRARETARRLQTVRADLDLARHQLR